MEVDGAVHDRPEVQAYDLRRTAWLEAIGICIVRIPNEAVLRDAEAVRAWLVGLLEAPR